MALRPLVNSRVIRNATRAVQGLRVVRPAPTDQSVSAAPGIVVQTNPNVGPLNDQEISIQEEIRGAADRTPPTRDPPREDSVEFEPAEEVYIAVGEPSLRFPKEIINVDQSGFIVKGNTIKFVRESSATSLDNAMVDRNIYILKQTFAADALTDDDISRDTAIVDYAAVFDGTDVEYDPITNNITYDSAEKNQLKNKFFRLNTTDAVFNNLLNTDFDLKNLVEPPIVQTIIPEQININNFSFLSDTSLRQLQLETISTARPGPSTIPTTRFTTGASAGTSGTGGSSGGGYS